MKQEDENEKDILKRSSKPIKSLGTWTNSSSLFCEVLSMNHCFIYAYVVLLIRIKSLQIHAVY